MRIPVAVFGVACGGWEVVWGFGGGGAGVLEGVGVEEVLEDVVVVEDVVKAKALGVAAFWGVWERRYTGRLGRSRLGRRTR